MKDIDKRLEKLEKRVAPGRLICALRCELNEELMLAGFMPHQPGTPPPPPLTAKKRFRNWLRDRERLGKDDQIVLMSEAELAL